MVILQCKVYGAQNAFISFVQSTPSVLPQDHPAKDRRGKSTENGGVTISHWVGIMIFMGT